MFHPPRLWPLVAFILSASASASAQSTAFSYQGRLDDAGRPAGGLYDVRFRLYDAATGGTQLGATRCTDNLAVTNGAFSATVDFGQQFASPQPRYLEIEVRRDAGLSCTDTGGFVILSPRQVLTPVPLATHANSAFALDAPDGSPTNAVYVDILGRVGVGTTNPQGPLEVRSGAASYVRIDSTNGDLHANGGTDGLFGIYNDSGPSGATDFVSQGVLRLRVANNGTVRFGPDASIFVPAADENVRIVRGVVDPGPVPGGEQIIAGSGFTITRLATGLMRITFTRPFASLPAVTATAQQPATGCLPWALTTTVSTTSATIQVECESGHANWPFSFIAVGPR